MLYYLTPYNYDDDLFILWFFLHTNCQSFIISNDKYRDHIFNLNNLKNDKFQEFKYIIKQQTISYDINMKCENFPTFSRCIQVSDKIYIPHISGKFIELNY